MSLKLRFTDLEPDLNIGITFAMFNGVGPTPISKLKLTICQIGSNNKLVLCLLILVRIVSHPGVYWPIRPATNTPNSSRVTGRSTILQAPQHGRRPPTSRVDGSSQFCPHLRKICVERIANLADSVRGSNITVFSVSPHRESVSITVLNNVLNSYL